MTKFNPENKKKLTIGDCLIPAMEITDAEDAKQYLKDYVSYSEQFFNEKSPQSAEEVCKINLGYFAGYYGNETRERVERLFDTSHTIFGDIKQNGVPTTTEALECGK